MNLDDYMVEASCFWCYCWFVIYDFDYIEYVCGCIIPIFVNAYPDIERNSFEYFIAMSVRDFLKCILHEDSLLILIALDYVHAPLWRLKL